MVREVRLFLPKQATSRSMKGVNGERGDGERDEWWEG
jgi:hypothetical protein